MCKFLLNYPKFGKVKDWPFEMTSFKVNWSSKIRYLFHIYSEYDESIMTTTNKELNFKFDSIPDFKKKEKRKGTWKVGADQVTSSFFLLKGGENFACEKW